MRFAALVGILPALAAADSIKSVARTWELEGSVSKAQSVVTLHATKDHFDIPVPAHAASHLSWLEVSIGTTKLSVRGSGTRNGMNYYAVSLPHDSHNQEITLNINEAHVHISQPKPKSLEQAADIQYLEWNGDLLAGLAQEYEVQEAVVRVKTPTPKTLSHDAPKAFKAEKKSGSNTITFTASSPVTGPQIASVHYEQPDPVMSVRHLNRYIEVSHWGNNVAFQDDMTIVNDGPKLKGHFARVIHQTQAYMRKSFSHIITGLSLGLPSDVSDPYYIDIVGNVSTSRFRPSTKRSSVSVLEIQPRYPIMGGWNYTCTIGYNRPLESVLRNAGKGRHILAVPFVGVLPKIALDNVTVQITLPEGASNVKVETPFAVDAQSEITHYSYLDTTGRPAVILQKTACTEKHSLDVLVSYTYTTANLWQKPLGVATAMFVCAFASGMILRRFSFKIDKTV